MMLIFSVHVYISIVINSNGLHKKNWTCTLEHKVNNENYFIRCLPQKCKLDQMKILSF